MQPLGHFSWRRREFHVTVLLQRECELRAQRDSALGGTRQNKETTEF